MIKLFRDTIFYFLSKFLPSIISILTLYFYINFMSTTDYGKYSILIVTAGLINIFSTQWLRSSMLKYNDVNIEIFSTIQTILIIFTSIIIIIVSYLMNVDIIFMICLVCIQISLSINEFLNNVFRQKLEPKIIMFSNLLKSLFLMILLLISVMFFEIIDFKMAVIFFGASLIISNIYYRKKMKKLFTNLSIINIAQLLENKKIIKQSFNYGFPITISFTVGVALQNIDKYMITHVLGISETGRYSLPFDTIHNFLYLVMGALGMASLPRLLKLNDSRNLKKNFDTYIYYFYLINLPLLSIFISNSKIIADFFTVKGYSVNSIIIIFIVLSTFAHGTKSFVYDQAVQLSEKTRAIFIPSICAIIITLLVNFVFLERFGIIVAAISSMLSFNISNFITYYFLLRKSHFSFINLKILKVIIVNTIISVVFLNIQIDSTSLFCILSVISTFILNILMIYFEDKNILRRLL